MSEKRFVLDTSALITFLKDEEGADEIQKLMDQAQRGRIEIFLCFITPMEILYALWRKIGQELARQKYEQVKKLPMAEIWPNETIREKAAFIKATYSLSLADAWIAATALEKGATLVHKDREFDPLKDLLPQLNLLKRRT